MNTVQSIPPAFTPVSTASASERVVFVRKTYAHLALAVLGFVFLEAIFLNTPWIVEIGISMLDGWFWLAALGGFMFVTNLAESWAYESTNKRSQYIALSVYVFAEALLFVPLMYLAIAITGDFALLAQAGLITFSLFLGLTSVAVWTKQDFSFLRTSLFVGSFIAMGLIVAGIAFGFSLGLWFSVAMVGLASVAILYQTTQVMTAYHTEQYVAASLGLFSALMLLLWYVINILFSLMGE